MDEERIFLDIFSGPDRRRVECPGGAHRAFMEADMMHLLPQHLPLDRSPDVVWASPPCTAHSTASLGHHWSVTEHGHMPETEDAAYLTALALRTAWFIRQLDPDWWFMENPRGKMRKVLPVRPAGTIWYCQYGHEAAKPTDLWGNHPSSFEYRGCGPDPIDCDHERAERGSTNAGTQEQGRDPVLRSIVPEGVSRAVLKAVEEPRGTKQGTMEGYM